MQPLIHQQPKGLRSGPPSPPLSMQEVHAHARLLSTSPCRWISFSLSLSLALSLLSLPSTRAYGYSALEYNATRCPFASGMRTDSPWEVGIAYRLVGCERAHLQPERRYARLRGFPASERAREEERRGRCSRLEEIPEGMDLPAGFIWALYVDLSPLSGRRWLRGRKTAGQEREAALAPGGEK